jgi:predicted AAA+ superfamily ATPase
VSAPTGIYFYRTAKGDEIDLLIQQDNQIMAYEIKTSVSVEPDDVRKYQNALDQLGLEKGTVIYFGRDDFMLTSRIEVKTARTLLLE